MARIETATVYQAQKLDQLIRLDKHVYTADHHKDGDIEVLTSEGKLPLTVDNHQRFTFWRMRRAIQQDLQQAGLGEVAAQTLKNRLALHRHVNLTGDY